MILKVRHQTTYHYTNEVHLEPHHLYFYPSQRDYLQVKSFEINMNPEPSGISFRLDAENNAYYQTWYNQPIQQLQIDVLFVVETHPVNPFNLLIEKQPKLDHSEALEIYLKCDQMSEDTNQWIHNIHDQSGENPLTFLTYLTKEVKSGWHHESRFEDNLMTPDQCYQSKSGSCRDLSWMMIQMLRNQHVAARFVSGYSFNPELTGGHELHAWVEAWVPGAGWIGLDPSAGILTTHEYIPIATSHRPANTFPVQGTYRGAAEAELTFEVKITAEQ